MTSGVILRGSFYTWLLTTWFSFGIDPSYSKGQYKYQCQGTHAGTDPKCEAVASGGVEDIPCDNRSDSSPDHGAEKDDTKESPMKTSPKILGNNR